MQNLLSYSFTCLIYVLVVVLIQILSVWNHTVWGGHGPPGPPVNPPLDASSFSCSGTLFFKPCKVSEHNTCAESTRFCWEFHFKHVKMMTRTYFYELVPSWHKSMMDFSKFKIPYTFLGNYFISSEKGSSRSSQQRSPTDLGMNVFSTARKSGNILLTYLKTFFLRHSSEYENVG